MTALVFAASLSFIWAVSNVAERIAEVFLIWASKVHAWTVRP